MDMQPVVVGIDIGFGKAKALVFDAETGKLRIITFPSVVGLAQTLDRTAILDGPRSKALSIRINGSRFYVGQDALTHSRAAGGRQDRERIGSDEERILMLATLAKLKLDCVRIVTGLPVLWMEDRKKLVHSWKGTHEVEINGKPRTIVVESVRTMPQPYGGFYSHVLNPDGTQKISDADMQRAFAFFDGGWNTSDLFGIKNLQSVEKWGGGEQLGVRTVIEIVTDQLQHRFGLSLEPHEVDEAVQAGSIDIYGEPVDITAIRNAAIEGVAKQVIALATRKWGNAERIKQVMFYGGLMLLPGMADHVLKAFPHNGICLPRAGLANALGFLYYGQRDIWAKSV